MKDVGIIILFMLLLCTCCSRMMGALLYKKITKGRRIAAHALPEPALEVLSELGRSAGASSNFYRYRRNYYVVFHNGEIWFTKEGELIKAKYYFTRLPEFLCRQIPEEILKSVAGNFPATYVSGFERTAEGYTISVFGQTDGELFFDGEGNFREAVNEGTEPDDCRTSHQRLPEHAIGY